MINKSKIRKNIQYSGASDNEDFQILEFLSKNPHINNLEVLEVGCGMCGFVRKLKESFPAIKITCVDINPRSIEIAKELGCDVFCGNILDVKLNKKYDIVHCSHVIEHFKYPEVTDLLDFLVDSTKDDGIVIIRSPLMWECFYFDIDHVRPYPPQAILNYFHLEQQQKQGNYRIKVIKIWYNTKPIRFNLLQPWNLLYHISIVHPVIDFFINHTNGILLRLWKMFRLPSTSPKTYMMAFKRDHQLQKS